MVLAGALMVSGPLAPLGESSGQVPIGLGQATKPAREYRAYVTPPLLSAAEASPARTFDVIVQGNGSGASGALAKLLASESAETVGRAFRTVDGIPATVSGRSLVRLAGHPGVAAITPDAPMEPAGFESWQKWPYVSEVARYWRSIDDGRVRPPAIAVVDSGVDATRPDFSVARNVVHQRVMTTLQPNAPGDGRGHGTFVAGIASGSARGYAGAAPTAPIVSIDVMDDHGMARTSDVIYASDWIYANRAAYNIRVANFSLNSSVPNSFMFDPLARAVERLWLGGVVVVAAAGNYAVDGQPSGVLFMPASDPFVITVGAADIGSRLGPEDDFAAPWSAYGHTPDGFRKPELGAPGRYIVGPVPPSSTLVSERPGQVRKPGYMELSGTSFSAPMVAGMAAYILARNPSWTPDQVKGALMLTARPAALAAPWSLGVGQAAGGRAAEVRNPPNPNAALNRFVRPSAGAGSEPVFDAASWAHAAREDASWAHSSYDAASWANASWANASWANASWASASWANASWASASWASSSLAAASWASASWARNTFEDAAQWEAGIGGVALTPEEELFVSATLEGDPTAP